jgi:mRNA-degrading endonuclease RelE of RelBE toxin-antitoxin system
VRQAMLLIGRIAAGESGAFTGIKRLKSSRDIVRQRIGDHRLLFRLHSHTIELLALIPRRDLERKIRSLSSA